MTTASGRLIPPPPAAVASALKVEHLTIDWLAGDGSDRCYFRVRSPELARPLVLMQLSGADAENLAKGRYDWVEVAGLLKEHKIPAPSCVAVVKEHAAILIDDYGDIMLETFALQKISKMKNSDVGPIYSQALAMIGQFLTIPARSGAVWTSRSFDQDRFEWELRFFVNKYLGPIAHYNLSAAEELEFSRDVQQLSKFLAADSKFFVHRDFHSRNLMIHDGSIAVIDFQDARLGPSTYDLVSLAFDSYVPLHPTIRMNLIEEGFEIIKSKVSYEACVRAKEEWRPMLLQRQLKAIGSFGYLTIDKHKGDYLKNVNPAVQTLLDAGVQDSRWPFLSGKLLQILAKTLPDRTYSCDPAPLKFSNGPG